MQRYTILIIEDDEDIRQLFKDALVPSRFDSPIFDCVFADRLSAAFGILDDNGIDAVILDLKLPGSTGGETVMKYLGYKPWMPPAIICSAFSDPVDIARFQQAGIAGYITKPPDFKELPNVLSGAVARGSYVRGLLGTIADLRLVIKDLQMAARKKRHRSRGEWAAIAVGILTVLAAVITLIGERMKGGH